MKLWFKVPRWWAEEKEYVQRVGGLRRAVPLLSRADRRAAGTASARPRGKKEKKGARAPIEYQFCDKENVVGASAKEGIAVTARDLFRMGKSAGQS